MGYIEDNLVKGEDIVFVTKLHWAAVIGPAVSDFAFGFILGLCLISSTRTAGGGGITLAVIGGILGAVGGFINYQSSEFGVTTRRVLIKTGLIRRQTLELNLNKIESFQVRESILGRIFGFHNLRVTGSGGTKQLFRYVSDADLLRRRVVELSTN